MINKHCLNQRVFKPILTNFPQLLLSWSLAAVIATVAQDPICRTLEMGSTSTLVYLAFGFTTKNVIVYLLIFYVVAGALFAFTGQKKPVTDVTLMFMRPIATPALFQIAGLGGGLYSVEKGLILGMIVSLVLIAFALAIYNFEALSARSKEKTQDPLPVPENM